MSVIPRRNTGLFDKDGQPIYGRVMLEAEIREREQLNRDNTAPRLRARIVAAQNGRCSPASPPPT